VRLEACAAVALAVAGASLAGSTEGQERTYSARPGETASSIAEAHYGDARLGGLLLAYNERPGGTVRSGERLTIPRCRTHRAASGETWAGLAKAWLGRASFGPILAELNGAPPERPLRIDERVVIPVVLRHKLGPKETLASLAGRFYGDPKKARILQAFGRFPNPRSPAPGTVIGIPITAFVAKPEVATVPAPAPAPAPAVAAVPPRQFAAPLGAAAMDFVYGDYDRARAALEGLRGQVASSGNVEDQRELSQLLAFTYVALDLGARACEAYAAAPAPRAELDPDLVSPKIRQALAGCGLDSPRGAPQIPPHGDEQTGREL
jgi:hypothetical protein